MADRPNEPVTLGPEGPEWRRLEGVLRRAVAKDPSARYQSVAELSRDLLPALRGLPPGRRCRRHGLSDDTHVTARVTAAAA